MDASRFDALTRSLTRRRSRRAVAAGGLAAGLAALGLERAAAQKACALQIQFTTVTGPDQNTIFAGTLNLSIGDDGAVDDGSFDTADGVSRPLVGQVTGRAMNLRIDFGNNQVVALQGTAANDLILCRGQASGTFGGPDDMDLGTWRTVSDQSGSTVPSGSSNNSSGNSGNSNNNSGNGSNNTGNSNGGGDNSGNGDGGGDSSGDGGGDCASGVV
ncbi:MAG: hypothetical protein ACRDHN_19210, partial [Thermomicrobiales bacterium]